ncbi:MAG: PhnD/SsuA/transferrin family substrate-binding protein [Pseudomonadota bacterium]|nr:PhnD/SsuA/transferrin family substrate-binding protein [Pseudomonadota bacterium]
MRHVSHGMYHLLLTLFLVIAATPLSAQPQTLVIGTVGGQFLPGSGDPQPFIDHLENALPQFDFSVRSFATIEALMAAVDSRELHFALITPVAYIQLDARNPMRTLATVTNQAGTVVTPWLAGMVFVRNERSDLQTLADARGRRVVALSPLGLGGWLAAVREWRDLGIDAERDFASVDFVFSYAQVVAEVCEGRADIGVLPGSGLQSGDAACANELRVLPAPGATSDARYPIPVSTRLYPEVAFAVIAEVDENIINRVARALLAIEAGSPAASSIAIAGFTAPLDYSPVAELMQELQLPPYENFGQFTVSEAVAQHGGKLLAVMSIFAAFLGIALWRTRQLNRKLAQTERFRSQIFQASRFPVVILDPQTFTFLDMNEAAVALYGYGHKSELIGHTPASVSAPEQYDGGDSRERLRNAQRENAMQAAPAVLDWQHRRPDGSVWDAEIHMMPFTSGSRELLQASIVDVTERKRMREEREKMEEQLRHSQRLESIGRLSGAIAHDFNNLLTVINGYSELLLMNAAREDANRDTYMQITQACWRARELTYQLLTFSRRQITRMEPVDLNKIILDSASMFRSLLGENIRLGTALNPNIGMTMADSGQIHQVLLNLVVNAKDAMPDGGLFSLTTDVVELDSAAAAGLRVDPGMYITVAAIDTGVGMSRETQEKIFEPFFTTKGEKGSGFGLATAYGIVRQCKGAIRFHSELHHGTTFTMYLPVTQVSRDSLIDNETRPPLEADGQRTILVVEDQPDVRMYACSVLQSAGYEVLEAESGDKALAVASAYQQPIDLLFTDVVLGGMNGRELAETFLRQYPDTRCLFTSGYADDEVALYGVIQDRIAFLSKPYSPHDLLAKARDVLTAAESQRPNT